jgi:lysyl endopeptidase
MPATRLSVATLVVFCCTTALANADATGAERRVSSAPYHSSERAASAEPGPLPASQRFNIDLSADLVPIALDAVDLNQLAAEDAATPQFPMRVGVNRPLGVDSTDAWAAYRVVPGVGSLWGVEIVSPGAQGLRLSLSHVALPHSTEMWIYSPKTPEAAEGPLDGSGPLGSGEFWTRIFTGERVRVEYFVPETVADDGFFLIDELAHIYRGLEPPVPTDGDGPEGRGWCHNDVMCFPEWHPLHNATARFYFDEGGYTWLCTGALLNTETSDETPYFVTANHCAPNDAAAATMVAQWFYQQEYCEGPDAPYEQSSYADVLWTSLSFDVSLLMFKGRLPLGVTWAGWDTETIAAGEDVACIGHPQGYRKKISFGDKQAHPWGDNQHYFGIYWTSGTIEGGSSGSGIYRVSNHNYIGVLSHTTDPTNCNYPEGPSGAGKFRNLYPGIASYLVAGSEDSFAPNHTCETAQLVGPGFYDNLVVKSVAEDWFEIVLNPCDQLDLLMSHVNNWGDIDLDFYDACGGNVVIEKHGSFGDKTFIYTHEGDTAQSYFLHVYLGNGDDDTRNEYTLTVDITNTGSPLPAPTNVQASDGDYCDEVHVSWSEVTGATEYSIWRSETDDSGTATQQGTSPTTSFVDDTTADSVIYYYWVKAHNDEPCTDSDFSDSDSGFSYCEPGCPGDLDGDNDVDLSDLAILLGNYGMTSGAVYEDGDLDEDGDVDLADLAALLGVYGTTCP